MVHAVFLGSTGEGTAVGNEDEYLRQAEEARRWADQSKTDKARAGWLRIAAQWLSLIPALSAGRETVGPLPKQSSNDQKPHQPSA
jgi:hypothetical protein